MTDNYFVELMDAFDALDSASQRMLVSQPFQMTEAAEKLNSARLEMRSVIQKAIRGRIAPPPAQDK